MATVSFAEIERTASWAGDVRINLFRLGAIVIFYGHHVLAHFVLRESAPLGAEYHRRVTLVVLAWAASVLWLYLALRRPWSPPWLKYALTAWDTAMITALLMVSSGPASSLVGLYFLVIAAAPLRLSLRGVYAATAAVLGGYAILLGYSVWKAGGYAAYYASEERISRPQQIVVMLSLLAAGVLAGQAVRQMRRLIAALGQSPP